MPTQKRRRTRLSEEVIRRQRPAIDIQASALSNAQQVAADLEDFLLQGLPEGETLPDIALTITILGNVVREHSEAMEAADEAHFEALSRLNHLQMVRDDYKSRLVPILSDIRNTFDTAFGPDSCQRILGLGIHLPVEPLRLRRIGDRVVRRTTAADFELPPPVTDIVSVDVTKWLQELTPELDGLRQTMEQISEAKRESERTLAAKTSAIKTYRGTYVRSTQMLSALFVVSGNDHLADKLRPTTPKSNTGGSKSDSDSSEPTDGPLDEGSETTESATSDAESEGDDEESLTDAEPESRARPDRPPVDAPSAPVSPILLAES